MDKILEIKFGSSLYFTSIPESDIDLKGIYLPTDKEKSVLRESPNKEWVDEFVYKVYSNIVRNS